jgi:LysM repeat protein
MNFTGALDAHNAKRPHGPKSDTADLGTTIKDALAAANTQRSGTAETSSPAATLATASVPSTYKVKGGDTVSGIAGRYGLSTASVLALNGLSWKSLIFPGQVLKLSKSSTSVKTAPAKPAPAKTTTASHYTIRKGDTIIAIAKKFGVSTTALLSANGLSWTSTIYAGRTLSIPSTKPASTGPVTPVTPPAKPPVVTPPVTPPADTTPPPVTPPVTPPAKPTPPPPPPAKPSSTKYTIKAGDTVTAIAKKFGVTVAAILGANGLVASSIIYTGHTLTIPGVKTASVGDSTVPLSPTMRANAAIIIKVGRQLGVSDYGLVIALAAAAQESGLQNVDYGDRDSVGLFQQRPSTGWGKESQLLDPSYASKLFFGGPGNPNKGKTRGLLDIKGWQSMSVTKAAQAVQISAYPDAYAKWEASARAWLKSIG